MRLAARHGLALVAILAASVAVRLAPVLPADLGGGGFAVWGSDSGEYLLLTERLVSTRTISFDYDGWGVAYPYFPGQFVLDGASRTVLGLDALDALRFTVPVLASILLPLGVFLLARRVVGDVRVALLAAAFLAVTPVNALVTSHPMPGTLGHVLLVAALVALADAYEDRAVLVLALLFALAIVPAHHLSTWFLAGAVAGTLLLREAGRAATDGAALRVEVPVLLAVALPAGAWWLGVAIPFRDGILGASGLPPLVAAAAGYALLLAIPAAVLLRRRLAPKATLRATYPSPHAKAALVAGLFVAVLSVLVALRFTRVPGGNIHVSDATLVYALPQVAWLAFAYVGARTLHLFRRGTLVLGWTAAILASLAVAVATGSRLLFPFRHPDYLVEALAIPVALGLVAAYDDLIVASTRKEKVVVRRVGRTAVAVLLVVTFLMSQPPRETIGGFEEGTTEAELGMVLWADERLPEGAVVAADHRLSSLLFGVAAIRPTWDSGAAIYHAEDWNSTKPLLDCADTLVDKCARVEYVVLSRTIQAGVITVQWEDAEPMAIPARAKFFEPENFELVYLDPREDDFVAVFEVVR